MFVWYLSLCCFVLLGIAECQYYFVTAPNVIRYEHNETVTVSVFGLTNADVEIWLELVKHNGRQFSKSRVVVTNEKNPVTATVRVKENDIFSVAEDKPRTIKICSQWSGFTQCRDTILSYQSGYLFVQTDKPIYTPLQKVQIRALALEESLRRFVNRTVSMEIISPTNMTLARQSTANTENGFFTSQFSLPPYPDIGVWTARAFYRGQFETSARTHFQVEEYVLPTFGVTVNVDVPYILVDTKSVVITVRAKYVYGKPVEGTARLTLNLKDKDGSTEYLLDMNPATLIKDGVIDGSLKQFDIPVNKILESPLLKNKDFPEGKRLEVVAVVYESVTGKEEARSDDSTMFALKPYRFQFTRSKHNFRPGWEYYLKVDMTYINGKAAANEGVKIKMFNNGVLSQEQELETDRSGQIVAIFGTEQTKKLEFTASTMDERQVSERFVVTPYEGKNQIQVEHLITEGKMSMRAYANIQGDGYTGMLFMIVTRGKVVYTHFENAANMKTAYISKELEEYISPSARLIVFYVDKSTNELVADSVKFEVEEKCRGEGLSLATLKNTIIPGMSDQLTVTGSKHMWVGLNVMDKALLLLNDKNVLKKNKVFSTLRSHDLGCGEGSGRSSGDVFKKSGLTILTNAVVSEGDLKRNTDSCDNMGRRKRNTGECYGAHPMCCKQAYELADELVNTTENIEKIDPYTKCYASARERALEKKLTTKCIMAYFYTCMAELKNAITDVTKIVSKTLEDDDEDYASDLARLAKEGVKPVTRSDFRESWLFDVVRLDDDGQKKIVVNYPDSITEWMFQAIGISEERGVCMADPLDVKAYRDFFIQLDLPYKAVRLEFIDIKATIFNYGLPTDDNKTANVYIEGVDHLCFSSEPNKPSPRILIELPPNSASTVTFPMSPIKAGEFPIKVTAMVTHFGIPLVDVVEKKLYVVNEGIEEKITIQLCLDPNKDQDDCRNDDRVVRDDFSGQAQMERILIVDLTLPKDSIAGTGAATGYIQSNIMDNVVTTLLNGVDNLFREPSGCGEQTMVKLAPTVYAMSYLKRTRQNTDEIERKGSQWIRDGVSWEKSQYRHPDGAYSIWQKIPASTWLTAFVAKVFCQAKDVVDDSVDEVEDLAITLEWLANHANADGSFVDNEPVRNRAMIGQINERDPSLTSFVLVGLLECPKRSQNVDRTIARSRSFVEGLDRGMLRNNPYILALSTYALALADSPKKWEFKDLLGSVANTVNREMYWGNAGGFPANAQSVETTAYALLAMLKLNDLRSSAAIVRWLTAQRNAEGSFRTTQDTVIGLQALSTYSIRTYSPDVNLDIFLVAKDWGGQQFSITKGNAIVQRIAKNLPVEIGENRLTVKASGSGSASMMIDLRYNRPAKSDEICPFVITDIEMDIWDDLTIDNNIGNLRNCDVCDKCEDPLQPAYDDDAFGVPQEIEPKIESNFDRKKRESRRQPRATKTKKCIRFSVSSKTDNIFGMSIVNFGLETDVQVVEDDLKKLMQENPNIARYELPSNGHGFIIFYLDKITKDETKFIFRLTDNYKGNEHTRQPSYVKVYDYYNPDRQCTHIYGTGPKRGDSVSYQCDETKEQCQCVRSTCATAIEDELRQLVKSGDRPAIKLIRYTCNSAKANYAVLVEIEEVTYNYDREEAVARGIVQKSLHRGAEALGQGDEMTFYWKLNCPLTLYSEKTYYIIGKDGHRFAADNAIRYPLMKTELIVDKDADETVQKIMDVYTRLITTRGCSS